MRYSDKISLWSLRWMHHNKKMFFARHYITIRIQQEVLEFIYFLRGREDNVRLIGNWLSWCFVQFDFVWRIARLSPRTCVHKEQDNLQNIRLFSCGCLVKLFAYLFNDADESKNRKAQEKSKWAANIGYKLWAVIIGSLFNHLERCRIHVAYHSVLRQRAGSCTHRNHFRGVVQPNLWAGSWLFWEQAPIHHRRWIDNGITWFLAIACGLVECTILVIVPWKKTFSENELMRYSMRMKYECLRFVVSD